MEVTRFTSIYINEEEFSEYDCDPKNQFVDNLLKLNIFIGPNNSGKSRFIRKMFSKDDLKFLTDKIDLHEVNKQIQQLKSEYEVVRTINTSRYFDDKEFPVPTLNEYECLKKHMDFSPIYSVLNKIIRTFKEHEYNFTSVEFRAISFARKYYQLFKNLLPEDQNITFLNFQSIYIPTLRGLRPIQIISPTGDSFSDSQDNYKLRTISDYFKSNSNNLENTIYTGLNLYKDIDKFSRGSIEERNNYKKFQKFLSETFFNNKDVELVARHNSDVVYLKIGNHEEPIYNLGDGIQSLIILTYPLFFNQGKTLKVFIEEPETHLHPGYQRIFIETLLKPEFNNFQYFITTHSNHFLDITIDNKDISVFTFTKIDTDADKPIFSITNTDNSDTGILSLIGVKNSSVFLSNCTIWVEGITDRIYLRKYLEIIQQGKEEKFKEDTHYSFVEYGGNNITHWSFLDNDDKNHQNILVDRLCGKLFLITDSDNAEFKKNGSIREKASKKAKRFNQLKEKLGTRFYCLKCREIENLVSPEVLISTIMEVEKGNQLIDFGNLTYKKYKHEYIGSFINNNFKNLRKNHATDSGSLANKVEFAKKAVPYIKNISYMSEEAKEISEKLYDFIQSQNK